MRFFYSNRGLFQQEDNHKENKIRKPHQKCSPIRICCTGPIHDHEKDTRGDRRTDCQSDATMAIEPMESPRYRQNIAATPAIPPTTASSKAGLSGGPTPLTKTMARTAPRPNMLEIISTLKTASWRLLSPPKKSATPQPRQAASDKLNAINLYSSPKYIRSRCVYS